MSDDDDGSSDVATAVCVSDGTIWVSRAAVGVLCHCVVSCEAILLGCFVHVCVLCPGKRLEAEGRGPALLIRNRGSGVFGLDSHKGVLRALVPRLIVAGGSLSASARHAPMLCMLSSPCCVEPLVRVRVARRWGTEEGLYIDMFVSSSDALAKYQRERKTTSIGNKALLLWLAVNRSQSKPRPTCAENRSVCLGRMHCSPT